MIINNFNFPDSFHYWFYPPYTFLWIEIEENDDLSFNLKFGLPEIVVKKINPIQQITFRSETLQLRSYGSFCHLYTTNQRFRFISPIRGSFAINQKIKRNFSSLTKEPYSLYLVSLSNVHQNSIDQFDFLNQNELLSTVNDIIRKKIFDGCDDCPDLSHGAIKRRL